MGLDLDKLANAGVLALQPYQPGKPIEELERELGINNIIKLASNENPLGISAKAANAIANASKELARYPDANGFYLKNKIAQYCQANAEQITLGNGSNEVLEILFRTFVGAGDEVIFDKHAFIVYALLTQSVGATAVAVDSINWGHDLEAMLAAITSKTRLICLANPNNPTGTYLTPELITAFLARVPENVLVVLDEAYFEYVPAEQRANSIEWLSRYPNLAVTRTFSKAFGLAGLRIGYLLSSPKMADLLNRVREPFNCNLLALAAAEAVLDDHEYVAQSLILNQQQMARMVGWCEQQGVAYIPSWGNFITIEVRNAPEIYQALLQQGIIVRPIAGYGMPDHLRISIGLAEEMTRLIAALEPLLKAVVK